MARGRIAGWLATILKTVLAVFVGVPLLLVATCAYTSFSPHLRLDPISAALMDAPRLEKQQWRTVDVDLSQKWLTVGTPQDAVFERLKSAGYDIFQDYSTDVGPRDPHPNDGMSQADLDAMFVKDRKFYNALGITHMFIRAGRMIPACGESLILVLGFPEGLLARATGYSRWTCM